MLQPPPGLQYPRSCRLGLEPRAGWIRGVQDNESAVRTSHRRDDAPGFSVSMLRANFENRMNAEKRHRGATAATREGRFYTPRESSTQPAEVDCSNDDLLHQSRSRSQFS